MNTEKLFEKFMEKRFPDYSQNTRYWEFDVEDLRLAFDEGHFISVMMLRDWQVRLRKELRGHPLSEIWGDNGLIAATMRKCDAYDKLMEENK